MKEFLSVPELRDNPLVQRVADVLDSNRSGEVDFKGKTKVVKSCLNFILLKT